MSDLPNVSHFSQLTVEFITPLEIGFAFDVKYRMLIIRNRTYNSVRVKLKVTLLILLFFRSKRLFVITVWIQPLPIVAKTSENIKFHLAVCILECVDDVKT